MYIHLVLGQPGKIPGLFAAPRIPPGALGCDAVPICSTLRGFPGCPRKAHDQPLGPEGRRKAVCVLQAAGPQLRGTTTIQDWLPKCWAHSIDFSI